MASYHLLQNKEHDQEVATPSSIGTRNVNPKLWKWISSLACFLCGCVFTIMSLVAGQYVFSNETALAEDLSILSTSLEKASAKEIVANRDSRYSSPWPLLHRVYARREVQDETVAGE